jgi:apolipoprotein D and lipocalin family protein
MPARARLAHRWTLIALVSLMLGIGSGLGPPASATPTATSVPRAVVPIGGLDLDRYAGRWLQLAAIPQFFSAECARDTQAVYTPLPDGLVKVENTCTRADGSLSVIEGRARVVGPSPAQLEVTFVQVAGQWIFQAAGDYWVLGVDQRSADYGWAVVGSPDRTSGFVLSRTPRLDARQIVSIVRTVLRNGYDPCAFTITATAGGIEENVPLCRAA